MEKKEKLTVMVMTTFGPVPFDTIKEHIDPETAKVIEENMDKIVEEAKRIELTASPSYYISRLAEKHGWKPEDMDKYLRKLYTISKGAVFTLILREIAVALDEKYDDHIRNSEEIYVVDLTNGHIGKTDKKLIKDYRYFAAFRNMEDARFACHVMKSYLRDMYKSTPKKDTPKKEDGE